MSSSPGTTDTGPRSDATSTPPVRTGHPAGKEATRKDTTPEPSWATVCWAPTCTRQRPPTPTATVPSWYLNSEGKANPDAYRADRGDLHCLIQPLARDTTFPDPEIESFYWMQYYKFASTARPGKPVLDLQGVWPTWDTPWPAIWMNLNIQLTYSFLTKANMGEFAQPLWDSLWEHRENLTRNVTDISGQEAWTDAACLGRTCSYDLYSPLSPSLAESNQYEAGNLCWTLFYWYQQCMAYGDDEAMRDRLFPLLKSAVNLFFHIRVTNPDGTYSLPATASPEYPVDNAGPNTNYDLANLRQALTELIEIDTRFGIIASHGYIEVARDSEG